MHDRDLLSQLEIFEPVTDSSLRAIRRPAGADLIVEYELTPAGSVHYQDLAPFWLATLWRFLEDSRQNTDAFEGLAYQAIAEKLTAVQFGTLYGAVRARLTLPPPYRVELREAYRILNGRVTSFAGTTTDGEFWAGYHQGEVYQSTARFE